VKSSFTAAIATLRAITAGNPSTDGFSLKFLALIAWHPTCFDALRHGEFGLKEVPPHHFSSFAVLQY
jgi:hypothetical protein